MPLNRYISTVSTLGVITSALLCLALVATTPVNVGPLGVTAWFLLLLVALSCWVGLAIYVVVRKLSKTAPSDLAASSWRRGLMVGGYVTILFALSSLRQLGTRDAILLLILLCLIEFYMVAKA